MEVGSSTSIPKSNTLPVKSQELDDKTKDTDITDGGDENKVSETDFSEFMKSALGGVGKAEVSEEELFAAIIDQRLSKENDEASKFFREQKAALMSSLSRPDGFYSHEELAVQALKATVAANKIDMTTAEKINGEAFQAAQLDSNLDALYDNRGGGDDPTIAVAATDAAIATAKAAMEGIEAGTKTAVSRALDTPINIKPAPLGGGSAVDSSGGAVSGGGGSGGSAPSGSQNAVDGKDGFLWKPESDSNGKLVVLLPKEFAHITDKVEIHSDLPPTSATLLGTGKFSSIANGDRPHYRFDKEGGDYGDNVHVVVYKDDGSTTTYDIEDGSKRID